MRVSFSDKIGYVQPVFPVWVRDQYQLEGNPICDFPEAISHLRAFPIHVYERLGGTLVRCLHSFRGPRRELRWALLASLLLFSSVAWPDSGPAGKDVTLEVPRVSQRPVLEDFLDMKPSPKWQGKLAKVENLTQRLPRDGQPSTQKTEVYLGYDEQYLYCIFVAFDSEPKKVRRHRTPRDNVTGDDKLDLFLDTYHDRRRAYVFTVNAYGHQLDGLWTEGPRNQYDGTWDTVWESRGQPTNRGFVVWIAVPFKSLRFPATEKQTWGIVFVRWIVRNNESATWPRVSTRIEGRMSQEATLKGLRGISPGRGDMLVPYAYARSFRTLDQSIASDPHFQSKSVEPRVGADAKLVLKRSFSLDMTANPDFSQVESDQPQITVNRRFEAYFPEKRPFFLENPSYFETPMNLLFTRNIADPQFGVRLTGKQGPYAVGALFADDRSPGESVVPGDPLEGKRAFFTVLRVNRDIFRQSTIGMIYTDREFAGTSNRVGGLDSRFKLNKNWWVTGQAVASSTSLPDGTRSAGPAYKVQARFDGRQFYSSAEYNDLSPGFNTLTGFIYTETVERPVYVGRTITRPPLRTDMRSASEIAMYRFRPEGKYFISWGPTVFVNPVWDHHGNRLDMYQDYTMSWEFTGQTAFEVYYQSDREMLRPQDFQGLTANQVYSHHRQGLYFETALLEKATFKADYSQGAQINVVPPSGRLPALANVSTASVSLLVRPERHLRMENTYLLDRLTDRASGASIFNNHIIRSTSTWQFNKKLSLRVIPQYNTVLANPLATSLSTTKNFNVDFLFAYLMNPFSAIYVGYNRNLDNLELLSTASAFQILRTRSLATDGRQFFVKFSYLVRF
jgi:hypothetical protein